MKRKQVRVVGNCQASAIANFYRDFVGAPANEDVSYVDDLGMDTPALQAAVAGADLVIVQERDFKHGLSREELGGAVEVFTFPLIMAGFLWPFANEPHVHNVPERPISDGPYPSQMSDSFLNRLIKKGVSPEDALDQYLALDMGRAASLDRMLEIYLDRQRQRDRATGFDIASAIEHGFRTDKMFLTAEHPDANIFGLVARQLFDAMGVSATSTDVALASLTRSPFPHTELPLHPGVIAHFGLAFADAGTRYTFLDEGRFTFAEYVLRYMRYANNPELRAGIFMAEREDPAATLERLERGLALSPDSPRGLRAKGAMLDKLGSSAEAVAPYRQAIAINPADPGPYVDLAQSRMRAGALAEAEAIAREAIAADPTFAPAHLILGEIRIHAGDAGGAIGSLLESLRLMPGRGLIYRMLGIAYSQSDALVEAEVYARRGMLMEPAVADHRNLVAEILEQQGRRIEAIALLEEGRTLGTDNDQTYSLLGNFRLRDGALAEAEEAFGRGAEMHGASRPDLTECLLEVRRLRARQAC